MRLNAHSPRMRFEALEERILHSADLLPLTLQADGGSAALEQQWLLPAPAAAQPARHEIVVVDARLLQAQSLIDGLARDGRSLDIVWLQAGDDGIARLTQALQGREGVAAIHLLTHGAAGQVQLGAVQLDQGTLLTRADELSAWGTALAGDADLLIYGCDVAASEVGLQLLHDLALLTGADVAASDDRTAASANAGDWVLERASGPIETALVLSSALQHSWSGSLAMLAYEPFTATGSLSGSAGGSGWTGSWSGSGSAIQLLGGGSLASPGGDLPTSGGLALLQQGGFFSTTTAERDLSTTRGADGSETWLSFVVQPNRTGLSNFLGLTFGSSSATVAYAGYTGSVFNIGQAGSLLSSPVFGATPQDGTATLLVVRMQHLPGNDTLTLYVNPTPGASGPGSALSASTSLNLGTFSRIGISGGSGLASNAARIDEIRVGQSYADVAPSAAPVIASNGGGDSAALSVAENTTAVTTVTATTPNAAAVSYSIAGGSDQARFTIDPATGALRFTAPPDFESPTDLGADNVYQVTVRATSGALSDTQAITVTVLDLGGPLTVTTAADLADGNVGSIELLLGNPGADGKISLREAIAASNNTANTAAGPDRILFNIGGGGLQTIRVQSALPTITQALVIDGSSQPGWAGAPLIELDGSAAGGASVGLSITGGGSTVRALVINQFRAGGISLTGAGGNWVAGNYIGLSANGSSAAGNAKDGIYIESANNTIGGTTAADRNVISGNGWAGIDLWRSSATGNLILGNYIG